MTGTLVPTDNSQDYLRGAVDIFSFALEKFQQSRAPVSATEPAVDVGGIRSTIGTEAKEEESANKKSSTLLWVAAGLGVVVLAFVVARLSR